MALLNRLDRREQMPQRWRTPSTEPRLISVAAFSFIVRWSPNKTSSFDEPATLEKQLLSRGDGALIQSAEGWQLSCVTSQDFSYAQFKHDRRWRLCSRFDAMKSHIFYSFFFFNTKRKEDLPFTYVRVPLVVVASKIKLISSLLTLPPKFSSLFCEFYVCDIQMRKDEECCNI